MKFVAREEQISSAFRARAKTKINKDIEPFKYEKYVQILHKDICINEKVRFVCSSISLVVSHHCSLNVG